MIIPVNARTDFRWLICLSRSRIERDRMQAEIAEIVETSCWRNSARGISGALIATPIYFAQYIEGPGEAAERLAAKVARDARHTDFRIIDLGRMIGAVGGCIVRLKHLRRGCCQTNVAIAAPGC